MSKWKGYYKNTENTKTIKGAKDSSVIDGGLYYDTGKNFKRANPTDFIFYNYDNCDFNCALRKLVDKGAGVDPGGWAQGDFTKKIGMLAFKWFIICLIAVCGYGMLRFILNQALQIGSKT